MEREIFLIIIAGIIIAIIQGCRRSNLEPTQEDQESADVRVLGQVRPDQIEPYERMPEVRRPGEPLWANHRLYEGLPEQPPQQRPWQNDRAIEEIIASMNNVNTPPAQRNVRRQRNQRTSNLEDPFAEGSAEGWTYEGGQRRSV